MITPEQHAALAELMQDCAQAQFDDCEFNVDGNGVNSHEGGTVLNKIAEIFGIDGPTVLLDRMYAADSDGAA